MKKTIAVLAALAILPALPAAAAAPQIANSSNSVLCSESAPGSYKRPGGYCDHIDDNNSLLPTGSPAPCRLDADAGIRFDDNGGIILVAVDPCGGHDDGCGGGGVGSLFDGLLPADVFRVAC